MSKQKIEETVREGLEKYLHDLQGATPNSLYDMVVLTVERPMLEVVMQHANQNQSVAAEMLGLNRNTLRKKLLLHGLI